MGIGTVNGWGRDGGKSGLSYGWTGWTAPLAIGSIGLDEGEMVVVGCLTDEMDGRRVGLIGWADKVDG